MTTHTTTTGRVKIGLALDPQTYGLLREMAAGPRSVGALLDDLIRAEATRRLAAPAPDALVSSDAPISAPVEEAQLPPAAARRLSRQSERLRILHEIDQALLAAQSPAEIAEAASQGVLRVTSAVRVAVALWQPADETLEILAVAGAGNDAMLPGVRFPLEQWPWYQAARQGQRVIEEDLAENPDLSPEGVAAAAQGIRSRVIIPLMAAEQPIGHLALSRFEAGAWPTEDLELAQQIADSLAVVVHHARLLDEVQQSRRQLRNLSHHLVALQEDERKRLSQELHDRSGQSTTALKLGLGLLRREVTALPAAAPQLLAHIDELRQLADTTTQELHDLAISLRPSALDRYGLIPALEQLLAAFRKQNHLVVEFIATGMDQIRMAEEAETALYRIVQEGLTNISRHAQAHRVGIILRRRGDRANLILEDDGCGFDVEDALRRGRLGLLGMAERAEMLGGALTIESKPGCGATLYVDVPMGPEAAEDDPLASLVAAPGREAAAEHETWLPEAELARAKALSDALNDLHHALTMQHTPTAILQTGLEAAANTLGMDIGAVYSREEDGWLITQVLDNHSELLHGRLTAAELPLTNLAALTGRVATAYDAQTDERFDPTTARRYGYYAAMSIPLTGHNGETDWVIGLGHSGGPRRFTGAEINYAQRLGDSVALVADNARLRQAETQQRDALARRVEELQALFELLPAAVCIANDPQCLDMRGNAAFLDMLGVAADANASMTAPADQRPTNFKVYREGRALAPEELTMQLAAATGQPQRDQIMEVYRDDGRVVVMLGSAVPLFDAAGRPRGAVGAFLDVAERQAAEAERARLLAELQEKTEELEIQEEELRGQNEELLALMYEHERALTALRQSEAGLRRSEATYRAIAQSFPNGAIYVFDQDLRYLVVEGELLPVMGQSSAAMEGKTAWEALDPETAAIVIPRYHRVLNGERLHFETQYGASYGNRIIAADYRPIRASATLDPAAPVAAGLLVVQDITARVHTEQALRDAAAQLEQRVAERTAELEAIITERQHAEEALRQQSARLAILHAVDRSILSAHAPGEIAQGAVEKMREATGAQRVILVQYDFAAQTVEMLAASGRGVTDIAPGESGPLSRYWSIGGQPAAGIVATLDDATALPDTDPWKSIVLERGIGSAMNAPLVVGGQVIGALGIAFAAPGALSAGVQELVVHVADSLALAIHNARLNEQVQANRQQLRALAQRGAELRERERGDVADQLYNDAGQVLAALKLQIAALERQAGQGQSPAAQLAAIKDTADHVLRNLHDLATRLRPVSLDQLGLAAAIGQYLTAFGQQYGLRTELAAPGMARVRLPVNLETALYRITQEALTNVAQHAHAGLVQVSLNRENDHLALRIYDDGEGFNVTMAAGAGGLGLLGIREEAESLGGRLEVVSAPGQGAAITIFVPLPRK